MEGGAGRREGGGRGWEVGEHTHKHTDSSRYREDGGRCGRADEDLQPAATSELKAGESSRSSGSNTGPCQPTPAAQPAGTERGTAPWLAAVSGCGDGVWSPLVGWLLAGWLEEQIAVQEM